MLWHASLVGQDLDALVDEALKKSGLVWLLVTTAEGDQRQQAVWHVWTGGNAYVLTGPGEQPDPGLAEADRVEVVVRSKDTTQRLVAFLATVSVVSPTDDDWEAATAELAKSRLNLSDAEHAPQRWAEDGHRVYRLTPTGDVTEQPGDYPDGSLRQAPAPSPATTRARLPRVFHRRGHSGRPLS